MAGRVADAQKDRLVLRARPGKGLVAPGEPVHGIVRVLEQVGRFLARQAVGVFATPLAGTGPKLKRAWFHAVVVIVVSAGGVLLQSASMLVLEKIGWPPEAARPP
jgi:hypothetical protein